MTLEQVRRLVDSYFVVERQLGQGASATVFRALRVPDGQRVALKVLRLPGAASRLQLRDEFRTRVGATHPNVVAVYELFDEVDADRAYFSMELVDGVDPFQFLNRTREPGEQGDRDDDARWVFLQLARAIQHLHKQGLMHRDVKPANVLVDAAGRVVLLDLGVALLAERPPGATAGAMDPAPRAGTEPYWAPESERGEPRFASDWYSFGVMLHEYLCGHPPRMGGAAVRRYGPTPLAVLCDRLVRGTPENRPNGAEVLDVLAGRAPHVRPGDEATPSDLVGRASELQVLHAGLRHLENGQGRVVVVEGAPGIGKSSLVREFRGQCADRAMLVLAGRCYQNEHIPYNGLDGVISGLVEHVRTRGRADVEAAIGEREARALARMFPRFEVLWGRPAADTFPPAEDPREAPVGVQETRDLAHDAMCRLLSWTAVERQVVVAIDDLQWADVATARLLRDVMFRPDPPSVLGILSMRSNPVEFVSESRVFLRLRGPYVVRVRMQGLATRDARDLLTLPLGENVLDPNVVDRLVDGAGGNPLYLTQWSRFLARQPHHAPNQGEGLDVLLRAQLEQLPEEHGQLLQLLAMHGEPVPPLALIELVDPELEASMRTVMELVHHSLCRLIRRRGDQELLVVYFHNDDFRHAVEASLDESRQRELHLRIAEYLVETPGWDGQGGGFRKFEHYRLAGRPDRAVEAAQDAVQVAMSTLAFDWAAELLEYLTTHAQTSADEHDFRQRRIAALQAAGRSLEAAEFQIDLARRSPELADRLHDQAARDYIASGHVEEGIRAIEPRVDVRKVLHLPPWRQALRVIYSRLRVLLWRIPSASRVQTPPRMAGASEEKQRLWMLAYNLSLSTPVRLIPLQAACFSWIMKHGSTAQRAEALGQEAALSATAGPYLARRTMRLLRRSEALAERIAEPTAAARHMAWHSLALLCLGRLDEAARIAEVARPQLAEHGDKMEQNYNIYVMYLSRYMLGRLDGFATAHQALVRRSSRQRDAYLASFHGGWMSWVVALLHDDVPTALSRIGEARLQFSEPYFEQITFLTTWGRAEMALYADDRDLLHEVLHDDWPRLCETLMLGVAMVNCGMAHVRGRMCLRLAEHSDATSQRQHLRNARRARWSLRLTGMPFATAFDKTLAAGENLILGQEERAVTALQEAEQRFQHLDMLGYFHAVRIVRAAVTERGNALVESQDALIDVGVSNPLAYAGSLVPGAGSRIRQYDKR